MGQIRYFHLSRVDVSRLFALAFRSGVQRGYIREIVRLRRLTPPAGTEQDAWPWALEVRTLGGFELRREGKPIQFSRKLPRKPLQLLKYLASQRGRLVSEAQLTGALWSQQSENAGARAFAIALHRLRRLIGERSVISRAGFVGLNADCVWLDARMFETLARSGSSRAVTLYSGPFLPGEHAASWTLDCREQLRRRFIEAVESDAQRCIAPGKWHEARKLYERSLELEPAAEELHRGLIRCHIVEGLRGEAVAAYRRCERALRSTFGVPPSERTRRLMEEAAGHPANR